MTWRQKEPLVLASASEARRRLLEKAGITCIIKPSTLDEEEIRKRFADHDPDNDEIALGLASMKAREVSLGTRDYVLGGDQVLEFKGALFAKPTNGEELRQQVERLNGEVHILKSAAAIAQRGRVLWRSLGQAHVEMRALDEAAIEEYCGVAESAIGCVGGYEIEALGSRIIRRIDGDVFTIQGMPLFDVLDALHRLGVIE